MTKSDLISRIAEKLNISKKFTASIVEEIFKSIKEALAKGEKCTFVRFGVFEVKHRVAREGRNPQNPTQVLHIPAKNVPVFRPGTDLREFRNFGNGGIPKRTSKACWKHCVHFGKDGTKMYETGTCAKYPRSIPHEIYFRGAVDRRCKYYEERSEARKIRIIRC